MKTYQPTSALPPAEERIDELRRSNRGGALRTIVDGRKTKPTGTFISLKAGFRSMPWESKRGELPVLKLCEVSPRVRFVMSQSQLLKFYVTGLRQPLEYFPDVEAEVCPTLIDDLAAGIPFAEAALATVFTRPRSRLRKLILEVKTEDDPRLEDEFYNEKLRLAREWYRRRGYAFFILERNVDLDCVNMEAVDRVVFDNRTGVGPMDMASVRALFASRGPEVPYFIAASAFGGGPRGQALVHAMIMRGILCLDFSNGLDRFSPLYLIRQSDGVTHASH